jgi:hypothetical protein
MALFPSFFGTRQDVIRKSEKLLLSKIQTSPETKCAGRVC